MVWYCYKNAYLLGLHWSLLIWLFSTSLHSRTHATKSLEGIYTNFCVNKTSDLLPWKHLTYATGPAKTINVWSLMIFMSIKGWEHVYPDGYYSETLPEKKRWWKRAWFPWPLLQCSSPKLGRPAVEAGILCAPLLYPQKVYWVLEHQGYGHMFCRSHWFHLPQCFFCRSHWFHLPQCFNVFFSPQKLEGFKQ